MPNWCMNRVYINGPTDKINELAAALKAGNFCSTVLPVPEPLLDEQSSSYGGDDADEKDALRARLTEQFGYANWYDFCCDNWGTKWDVEDATPTVDPSSYPGWSELETSFESAWSPPEGIYAALVKMGLEVDAFYFEPGMSFAGRWCNGVCDHYAIQTVQDARDLPPNIEHNMHVVNWYEEQEEEA